MKTEKKEYTAPALTVVTFKVEKGYALSGLGLTAEFQLNDAPSQEQWYEDISYYDNESYRWSDNTL